MTWKEKADEWGGAAVSFLSEDGECIDFCVVADPVLIEGKFQGRPTQRVGAPIVTIDGFSLMIMGKRLFRKLSKREKDFGKHAFEIIRHGGADDTKTKYELINCPDAELETELLKLAAAGVEQTDINESIAEATEIANQ